MNGTVVWALRRSASGAPILLLSLPLLGVARLLPEYGFGLWLRLVAASLVLLLPGALIARALHLRGASATVAWGLGALGPALLLVFVVVAYAVSANSIRGVAAARKEEVTITRLLGARGWMLRGPFMVEGLMTGALAGALAGALVGGAWLLSSRFAAATYAQVLPGVGLTSTRYVVAAVIVAGLLLGLLTATFGFRRSRA